jgi:hypothetical protein
MVASVHSKNLIWAAFSSPLSPLRRITPWVLLPRHPQLDHHPLLAFVIDHEMAMQEQAPVFLKARALRSCGQGARNRGAWPTGQCSSELAAAPVAGIFQIPIVTHR